MKKIILSFILLIAYQLGNAQFSPINWSWRAWRLFPMEQKSQYTYSITEPTPGLKGTIKMMKSDRLTTIHMDFMRSGEHYFNTTYTGNNKECYKQVISSVNDTRAYGIMENAGFGLLKEFNYVYKDRVDQLGKSYGEFNFFNFTKKNDAWSIDISYPNCKWNKIWIKCIAVRAEIVWGVPDTVKYYTIKAYKDYDSIASPFDTMPIMLSKTFGLLRFIAFQDILRPIADGQYMRYLKMIGLKSKTYTKGFQMPKGKDYFKFMPGDVFMKISQHSEPTAIFLNPDDIVTDQYDYLIHTLYDRDSIISKKWYGEDSVEYVFQREVKNIRTGGISKSTYKGGVNKFFLDLLENAPSAYPSLTPSNDRLDANGANIFFNKKDTTVARYFYNPNIYYDSTLNCKYTQTNYQSTKDSYTTGYGIPSYYDYSIYRSPLNNYDQGSVIGYRQDGVTQGPINFKQLEDSLRPILNSMEMKNSVLEKSIIIYPNPTTSSLNITSTQKLIKITVFQSTGYKVLETENCDEQIDVSALPSGLYLLEVWNMNGNRAVKKFEK